MGISIGGAWNGYGIDGKERSALGHRKEGVGTVTSIGGARDIGWNVHW